VGDLLTGLGRLPRWLLGDYLTGVRVDPRARGFYHDRGRNVIWAYSVGVDLIPSNDGVWCVEANLSSGAFQEDGWEELETDRAIERLFLAVREMGVETLWWHGMDWFPVHPRLTHALTKTARAAGMKIIIQEDFRIPAPAEFPDGLPRPQKRLMSPTHPPENTLVFRRNDYRVGSDWVVSDKEPFIRSIGTSLREAGDERCRVPAMTLTPTTLLPPTDDGMPNLVYKYPNSEWGFGVHFMRVSEPAHAVAIARQLDRETGNPPGLFQPFVTSRLLPGRRVYDIRCELMISPLGVEIIYWDRRESQQSIPPVLEEGLVRDKGVYNSNIATGGEGAPMDPAEEDELRDAALAVGEGLVRLLSRGFETVG
jgi:hypothetical protein